MVILANTFLDTSLVTSCSTHVVVAHRSRGPSSFLPSASLQNTEEQHVQQKKSPSPSPSSSSSSSSWIPFFLAGKSQKPLLEDMGASQVGATAFDNVLIAHEPAKMSTKKAPRGTKRVTFTPQKARELREKLKGTDSFHDFMYHSAIASRLASHDS